MSPRFTRAELEAARSRTIEDVIAPGLDVLFVGINPGLYSGATGHHFARPGNRFWPALHRGGFTPRQLQPSEQEALLDLGLGITNLVPRTTATAAELTDEEVRAGGQALEAKVRRFEPRVVAFLGVTTYRVITGRKKAGVGEQQEPFAGARTWVLPNPSGLNAHYNLDALAELFAGLRRAAGVPRDERGQGT